MERSQMCIANVRYKQPSQDGSRQSKNLLKYLTYRDSRNDYVSPYSGRERWIDHGMGCSVAEIANRCTDLHSDDVLLFSLVINPNPDLITMIQPDEREQFVKELTENTVEVFFDERDVDTGIEYSYVVHHRITDDREAPGRHNPHTHVVLPGTVYSEDHGVRVPLYFSRNKQVNHIDMLHQTNQQQMVHLLEQYIGLDWEQRIDALEAYRQQQMEIAHTPPHGRHREDSFTSNFWVGSRAIDEQSSAVGYYSYARDKDEKLSLHFQPLINDLDHEDAEVLSVYLQKKIEGNLDFLKAHAAVINGMSEGERLNFLNDLQDKHMSLADDPDMDLEM